MNRIVCSFSGGRTSGFMAAAIKRQWTDCEVVYVFANTGQEREETLQFVHRLDQEIGLGVVWLEAAITPELGVGTSHRIVTFETACRDASLFDAMCAKYGISNKASPHCTRELKLHPINSYLRSIGWAKGNYKTAVGIRADEQHRANGRERDIIYPLIDVWPVDKQDINTAWERMPFNLQLQEHQGNCKWCWKKSDSKLVRIAKEDRSVFDVPMELERKYGTSGAKFRDGRVSPPQTFFRSHRSAIQILQLADTWPDQLPLINESELAGTCSESCEYVEAA